MLDLPRLRLLTRPSEEIGALEVSTLLASGLIWGGILVGGQHLRDTIGLTPERDTLAIWPKVAAMTPGSQLWAVVRVREGPLYVGWIKHFSFDPAQADRDFYLSPAFLVDDSLQVRREFRPGGVYLNTRDVTAIEFLPGRT